MRSGSCICTTAEVSAVADHGVTGRLFRAAYTGTRPGVPPPSGRGRGGGDAGSLLPGVLPPELVACVGAYRQRHVSYITSEPQPPQPPQSPQPPHTTHTTLASHVAPCVTFIFGDV